MKVKLIYIFITILLFTSSMFSQSGKVNQSSAKTFTVDGECDVRVCHFEIINFKYGKNLIISVGDGDSSLSYFFSVSFFQDKISKEYIYHEKPYPHFVVKVEKDPYSDSFYTQESDGEIRVTDELDKLLLDVYRLGTKIATNFNFEKEDKTRYSETGKFSVLKSLRLYLSSQTNSTETVNTNNNADNQSQTLPTQIKNYLNTNYKGWKLIKGDPICESKSFVSGDFDGNKKVDFAVMFSKGKKGYVFAFLNQGTNYKAHFLEDREVEGTTTNWFLGIGKKGESIEPIIGEDLERGPAQQLKNDAPIGGGCESSEYFWIYSNGSFKRVFTSD